MSVPIKATTGDNFNSGSRSSSDNASQRSLSKSLDQPRLNLPTDNSAVATSSKRVQESDLDPRKRLQGLRRRSHKEHYGHPLVPGGANNVENPLSPSVPAAADMQNFQDLVTRRIEGLAKVQDRQGIDVERPRLGLLHEVSYPQIVISVLRSL